MPTPTQIAETFATNTSHERARKVIEDVLRKVRATRRAVLELPVRSIEGEPHVHYRDVLRLLDEL